MTNPVSISNEAKLLTVLCRLEFNEKQCSKIRDLLSNVTDWNLFLSLANAHGIIALACHNLQRLDLWDSVPAEAAAILRNALMKSLARNEFNMTVTAEALNLLGRENIRPVLLKGMALELTVYGNCGLRQMSDIDILIRKHQCLSARELLISEGFRSLPVKSVLHRLILKHVGKHLPSLEKKGALVEIHHELFGGNDNELTRLFFKKSNEIEIKGEKAHIPDPQIFFLYLVRHLWLHEKNDESQLRLYTDLAVLIEKYRDDILNEELLEYALRDGLQEVLASRLKVLKDHLDIRFPSWIDDFIDRWHDPGFNDKFIYFLGSPKGNPSSDKSWYYRHFVNEIPGFHRRLIFVAGDLFPTISFMKKRYRCNSAWKALLYYPHRAGKIFYLFRKNKTISK